MTAKVPCWLITGASGLLGCNFLHETLQRKSAITIAAFSRSSRLTFSKASVRTIDLTACSHTQQLLDSLAPSTLFHFAAPTSVDWCQDHPEETKCNIVDVSKNLAVWCSQHDCRMVYMSTDSVFDGLRGGYSEQDATGPLNI